ncbi:hypothetical protein ACYSNU_18815 [Enterococcus sp. LJL120]
MKQAKLSDTTKKIIENKLQAFKTALMENHNKFITKWYGNRNTQQNQLKNSKKSSLK